MRMQNIALLCEGRTIGKIKLPQGAYEKLEELAADAGQTLDEFVASRLRAALGRAEDVAQNVMEALPAPTLEECVEEVESQIEAYGDYKKRPPPPRFGNADHHQPAALGGTALEELCPTTQSRVTMKTIAISDELFAECQRIGAALERTPDEVAAVLMGDLARETNQYQSPLEIVELLDFFEYGTKTEKRVRHRLADMVRQERFHADPDPRITEAAAREVETGKRLLEYAYVVDA